MSIRLASQYAAMGLSLVIVIMALVSCRLKRSKLYSNLMWLTYGLVGLVFYMITLCRPEMPLSSHDLSPIRTLIQYTMVASWLFLWSFTNFKNGHS